MQCVSRIVQCLAEQPVVGLIQQLLKVRQIRRAVASTFAASQERVDSFKVAKPLHAGEAYIICNYDGDSDSRLHYHCVLFFLTVTVTDVVI